MKLIIIILFIGNWTCTLFGQEYAEFTTDTTRFARFYEEGEGKLPEYISKQLWFINGQEMRYGSGLVRLAVNPNKVDTILYKGYRRNEFDTIICNISEAKSYKFYYNDCCGAFNIQDETTGRFIQGKIVYQLKNSKNKTYLGTLGESGILIEGNKSDTLKPHCISAMSPNVYQITFSEIELCKDSTNCTEAICMDVDNEVDWEFEFKTISKKIDILFMPLSSDPILIIYDEKTQLIEMK
jgi:hypothetical protein